MPICVSYAIQMIAVDSYSYGIMNPVSPTGKLSPVIIFPPPIIITGVFSPLRHMDSNSGGDTIVPQLEFWTLRQ